MTTNSAGQWAYKDSDQDARYGDEQSYVKAAEFLDGCGPVVEDWGCGTGYARRFFTKSRYIGVDGSGAKWTDVVSDLALHRSSPDGILMRHVLEHNFNWPEILKNAIRCFTKRMVIVFFLPPETGVTRLHAKEPYDPFIPVPNLVISRYKLVEALAGLRVREDRIGGLEHTALTTEEAIFYLEKFEVES
jgi:hypothetical protein